MGAVKNFFNLFLKGVAMGAANVIPGVSGGTIAFITGIYEKLIYSLKSIDVKAMKLFFTGRFRSFAEHINFNFLLALMAGIMVSVISLAKLLEYLLEHYAILTWAFFFGLILGSVVFVGKMIRQWSAGVIFAFLLGTGIALSVAFLHPGEGNSAFWYVFLCGVVAICSMILPGLSGSFILVIMGNYALILAAIPALDFSILIPLLIGAVSGLVVFSHLLSWIFKYFREVTISLLTGFILGSLALLWPWKTAVTGEYRIGQEIKEKVVGYDWHLPELFGGSMTASFQGETILALVFMITGFIAIWFIEQYSKSVETYEEEPVMDSSS